MRFCLAEPRLFLTQLRAILRASHYGNVRILVPMLASVGEIDQTLALIEQAKETLREQGVPFNSRVEVGGMIEIPAAVLAMGAFLHEARFPVDRHQRPDPVHARRRPRRRGGVAPVRSAASRRSLRLLALAIGSADKAKVPDRRVRRDGRRGRS